jgi:DNA-binding NarL/FixJ family response regulator
MQARIGQGAYLFASHLAQPGAGPFEIEADRPLSRAGRALRILVVEDDRLVAMDHSAVISYLGGEVVGETSCGEEAVCLAEDLNPDVVLMDIRLKGDIDGIDAAGLISLRLDTPIVFVTAYGDPLTFARVAELGLAEPVLKPASVAQLRDAILAACQS